MWSKVEGVNPGPKQWAPVFVGILPMMSVQLHHWDPIIIDVKLSRGGVQIPWDLLYSHLSLGLHWINI